MDQQKTDLVAKLKSANNILLTVSTNPSVDQLSACIGLTILLNKLKKHATAVFSGAVPSTIEFLKPEDTLEKNTDSLRDFIIALDKSKADKLRYKVEENVVKIFITPYRTSISQDDLQFSQGDFNVDIVLALGVKEQQDLDQAITSHGRILHDAVVATVNTTAGGEIGTLNWTVPTASSLSELSLQIADDLGKDLIDAQIATAFLTGIVAETGRFSNEKTSPETMRRSAELLTAGANQQLVASELQAQLQGASTNSPQTPTAPAHVADGTLEITHIPEEVPKKQDEAPPPPPPPPPPPIPLPPLPLQPQRPLESIYDVKATGDSAESEGNSLATKGNTAGPHIMTEPPTLGGGALTASAVPEDQEADTALDPLGARAETGPILNHDDPLTVKPELNKLLDLPSPNGNNAPPPPPPQTVVPPPPLPPPPPPEPVIPQLPPPLPPPPPAPEPVPPLTDGQIHIDAQGNLQVPQPPGPPPPVPPPADVLPPVQGSETLTEIEKSVHSPHIEPAALASNPTASQPDVTDARDAVMDAINSAPVTGALEPKQNVGASGYLSVQDLPDETLPPPSAGGLAPYLPSPSEPAQVVDSDNPAGLSLPPANPTPPTSAAAGPAAPPPVPPPIPFDDLSKFSQSS